MYVTRTSVKFSQVQTLVYVGMLLYNLAESSSKWPCRDSVLQVAKPIFPHSRYFKFIPLYFGSHLDMWPSDEASAGC